MISSKSVKRLAYFTLFWAFFCAGLGFYWLFMFTLVGLIMGLLEFGAAALMYHCFKQNMESYRQAKEFEEEMGKTP